MERWKLPRRRPVPPVQACRLCGCPVVYQVERAALEGLTSDRAHARCVACGWCQLHRCVDGD